jgi:hypothetical protein
VRITFGAFLVLPLEAASVGGRSRTPPTSRRAMIGNRESVVLDFTQPGRAGRRLLGLARQEGLNVTGKSAECSRNMTMGGDIERRP